MHISVSIIVQLKAIYIYFSTSYFIFDKDKNEKDDALRAIERDDIAFEMDTLATDGR